ncbi:MAG: DUF1028 domain-containing protein [Alphaproteobacteria bacterium]|nr:DUF1028 domain-containing protein [Alphaproteobacteria bacterium]
MTWSIVAHDPATGAFGVAVATRAFAVGARCPWLRAGVGAVSTQSMSNHYLGPAILDRLAHGVEPAQAIEAALAGDAGRGLRQVHCVDRHGRTAAWTGGNCVEWCGHRTADGFSVAGNMLAGAPVVEASREAYARGAGTPFPERLLGALVAGQAAGGDKRGKQSAALMVTTDDIIPDVNLRVDDHADPIPELGRLLAIWRRDVEPRRHWYPSLANPAGLTDLDAMEAEWKRRGLDLRFRR